MRAGLRKHKLCTPDRYGISYTIICNVCMQHLHQMFMYRIRLISEGEKQRQNTSRVNFHAVLLFYQELSVEVLAAIFNLLVFWWSNLLRFALHFFFTWFREATKKITTIQYSFISVFRVWYKRDWIYSSKKNLPIYESVLSTKSWRKWFPIFHQFNWWQYLLY